MYGAKIHNISRRVDITPDTPDLDGGLTPIRNMEYHDKSTIFAEEKKMSRHSPYKYETDDNNSYPDVGTAALRQQKDTLSVKSIEQSKVNVPKLPLPQPQHQQSMLRAMHEESKDRDVLLQNSKSLKKESVNSNESLFGTGSKN